MWQRIGKQVAAAGLAALVLAGCQSIPQGPTAADDPQQGWSQLQAQVGKYQHEAPYLQNGVMAERLQHLLGAHTPEFLRNIEVAGPLQQEGSVYFITGNRPHEGGDNAGAVALDAQTNTMRIWWLQNGQPRVIQDAGASFGWPRDVNKMISNVVTGAKAPGHGAG